MHYFNTFIESYGWEGLSLAIIAFVLLSIQLYYYLFRYTRIAKYRNNTRKELMPEPPPVSVIIPMFAENYSFIEEQLPLIVAQEGVQFEIVIVYVGSNRDFYDDITRLKQAFDNIVITKIERNDRFPISVKTALNVGIKASHHECLLFTTTDAYPSSDRWLSLMSKGFQRGNIVLGYCAMEPNKGLAHYAMRADRLVESMNWLSSAVSKKPYRAIRSNMGFTRSLYFGTNGFNYLNMNIGEDDLFMQDIMNPANVSIILSPRATMRQKAWGKLGWWTSVRRFYDSAIQFYPRSAVGYMRWESYSRSLLFLAALFAIVFMPLEFKLGALILLLIRLICVLVTVAKVAKRLGEEKIVGGYILYDLFSPLLSLYVRLTLLKKDKRVWR